MAADRSTALDKARRCSQALAIALALVYVGYVLYLKFSRCCATGGPLGNVGEFLLVLTSVTAFGVSLFIAEAERERGREPRDTA
jgi:hypothetical protein